MKRWWLWLLAGEWIALRALDLARLSVPLERALAMTTVLLFCGGVLREVAALGERWDARMLSLAALLAVLQLALARAFAFEPGVGVGVAVGSAFGPLTVWPAVEARAAGVRLLLTPGWLALVAATSAVAAVALARASRRALCSLAGALAASACPACASPLAMALLAAGASAGGVAMLLQPTGVVESLAEVLPPLLALAALGAGAGAASTLPGSRRSAAPVAFAALALWSLAPAGSDVQQRILGLFDAFQALGIALALLLLAYVVFVAVRYRREAQGPPAPLPPAGTRRAWQVAWVVAPLLLLAGLCVASLVVLADISHDPPATERVTVVAEQWGWEFRYADNSTSLNELRARAGDEVLLNVTSADVNHALFVPDLGVNVDAIQGHPNEVRFRVLGAGEHQGYCSEFCGIGHADMTLRVVVT